MRKVTHLLSRFWSTDRSLTVLLGFLIINIFILQPLTELGIFRAFFVPDVLFSLILISGVMAIAKSRFITVLALAFALVTFLVRWAKNFVAGTGLMTLDTFLSIVFLGLLAVVVLLQVFREGPITMQRISGAVVVYLLLGLMWAVAYQLIELQQPGSFNFADVPAIGDTLSARLVYFSYITLTTLGYGDITAVSPIARSLAMLEGGDRSAFSSHLDSQACVHGALLQEVEVEAMCYNLSLDN